MTDNKSLTYLMQLEENTKSEFTEVKNKIDSIDLSIGDLSSITSTISDMQGSILSMKNSIDNMYSFVNETNIIVKDILNGKQISEWVDDLQEFGTNSTTYKDATRMKKLISNYDACVNTNIDDLLFLWSVTNSTIGTYVGTSLQNPSDVSWDTLTTPSVLSSNASAFTHLCNDKRIFSLYLSNDTCKTSMWDKASTTQSILIASAIAKSVLNENKIKKTVKYSGSPVSGSGKFFVLGVDASYLCNMTFKKNGLQVYNIYPQSSSSSDTGYRDVNKFADSYTFSAYYYNDHYFYYVDFA